MTTGTTPKGYPYPNGDDPIANGDDVIKNLATAVDTHLGRTASNRQAFPNTVSNTLETAAITFPAGRFTVAPFVLTNPGSSDPRTRASGPTSITTTGFIINSVAQAGGSYQVYWIASQT